MIRSDFSWVSFGSRITVFDDFYAKFIQAAAQVQNWNATIEFAHQQGVAPLLAWHLNNSSRNGFPVDQKVSSVFNTLLQRQHRYVKIRTQLLTKILGNLSNAGLHVIVLKGAALGYSLYPEPEFRPMRDIDLLLPPDQAKRAQSCLIESGFGEVQHKSTAGHQHLTPVYCRIEEVDIYIEIHRDLFKRCPPGYSHPGFAKLYDGSQPFKIGEHQARCLGNEDMLWHLYEHGFRLPLASEPYRLISLADVSGWLEINHNKFDWKSFRVHHPRIMRSLVYLGCITPWQAPVQQHLPKLRSSIKKLSAIGQPYPNKKPGDLFSSQCFRVLKQLLWPGEWWLRTYYGVNTDWAYWLFRVIVHPLHLCIRLATYLCEVRGDFAVNQKDDKIKRNV